MCFKIANLKSQICITFGSSEIISKIDLMIWEFIKRNKSNPNSAEYMKLLYHVDGEANP